MILLQLFWEFFKIGLFAVGGGMATVPFLYDLADKTGWFTHAQLVDMIAISESTPGPIGVNMSTYVGFVTADIPGAILATLGLITPSLIIALLIAGVLTQFRRNRYVEGAFYGLRPASTALIAGAGITIVGLSLLNTAAFAASGALGDLFQWKGLLLAAIVLVLTNWVKPTKKWHPIVFIGLSAAAGILFRFSGV